MPSILLRQSNVVSDPSATIKGAPLTNPEVDNNFANINIAIGNLNNLSTQAKANIVITINELNSNIGNLATLQTSNTSNLVSAINELRQNLTAGVVIETSRLADASITSAKLATNSITTVKIFDGNVTTSKIADSNVTTSKLADNAITSAKIANSAVTTEKITDGAVTTVKLSNTGVTAAVYGNAIRIPQITVGSDGRITSASNVSISGAGFTNLNADSITTGTISAERGGTGQNSWSTGQMLYASNTNTLEKLQIGSESSILTVSGGIPTWAANIYALGVTSIQLSGGSTGLSFSGGPITSSGTITIGGTLSVASGGTGRTSAAYVDLASNVFGTLPIGRGGTGTTSTTFVDLTTNVTGTLPVARGGTGFDSYTAGQLLYASGSTTLTRLGIGTTGHYLRVSSAGVPEWAAVTGTGITSLGVSSQGGSLGLTIESNTTNPITSTGTLSLSLSSASTFRSNLGLGSMATQDTSILNSYATTSSLSSYALTSSLSNYASLNGNNTFNGTNQFNSSANYYNSHQFFGDVYFGTSYGNNFSVGGSPPSPQWNSFFQSQAAHPAAVFYGYSSGAVGIAVTADAFPYNQINFFVGNPYSYTAVGSIDAITGNSVRYNTTSDYRLKSDVISLTDSISRLKQLNPVKFKWKNNLAFGYQEGFLAHEVGQICPTAVSGEKDAVNEDGSIKPQNIDTSYLIPLLTSSLKEAVARIETLEAEIALLKS